MRWQRLFADLSAQFEAAETVADEADLASRVRAEVGAVGLRDRLRAVLGSAVELRCRDVGSVEGLLADVGVDWLLLVERGQDVLVAWRAVQAVANIGRDSAPLIEAGVVGSRLDLRWALRAVARDRSPVRVVLDGGRELIGTIDRVGADFVELAEHAAGEYRRAGAVRRVLALLIDAVVLVQTLPAGVV